MLVFLDRQHVGKPNRWKDLGASRDLDGNGRVSIRENEAILTGFYILYAEMKLREYGHDVCVLSDGHYSNRHDRCNDYQGGGDAVYVACHINAGALHGGYGSCFFDFRSTTGSALSSEICQKLATIPELNQRIKIIESRPDDWTRNAFNTIKNVRCTAVCFEPFFIDCESHQSLMSDSGLRIVGECLADGIHNYYTTRIEQ